MEKKIQLTVALAVHNEEANLKRCLDSVLGIADEIVVVDGASTDKTVEIAVKYNARIIEADNPSIFHINKQKALDAASGSWVLQLDADEEITSGLGKEIREVISMSDSQIRTRQIPEDKKRLFMRHQNLIENRNGKKEVKRHEITAFYIPRRNYFLGGPIKFAGTYPDGVIRLIKKGFARFPAKSVHEQIETDGEISWLISDLLHYSNPNLRKYIQNADKYTQLLTDELYVQFPKLSISQIFDYLIIKPIITFLILYFYHKGILDGWRGFLFSLFSSLYYPVVLLKYISGKIRQK
jgi:(heptosyl)LPS beta-1,4-glucosyltransferase